MVITRENLYDGFFIPLSELRKEWHSAIYALKDGFDVSEPRTELEHYIERRRRAYIEEKLIRCSRICQGELEREAEEEEHGGDR